MTPQDRQVLKHLQRSGSIGTKDALHYYGIERLAARIHSLRSTGIEITTILRTVYSRGVARRVAEYRLK